MRGALSARILERSKYTTAMRDRRMWCAGAIKNESCTTGGIHQRRVRTASGSDRILRATQHKHLTRKLLFYPAATARGSDRMRGASHILTTPPRSAMHICDYASA